MADTTVTSNSGAEPAPQPGISAADFPGLSVLAIVIPPRSDLSTTSEQSPVSIRNGMLTLRVAGFNPDEASQDFHSLGERGKRTTVLVDSI